MKEVIIALLVLAVVCLVFILTRKNSEIKRLELINKNVLISNAFLDGITNPDLEGPNLHILETINSGMLSLFSKRLAIFYCNRFFQGKPDYEVLGIYLSTINQKISDERRRSAILEILREALLKSKPEQLGDMVALILVGKETLKLKDSHGHLKLAYEFIIKNLPDKMAPAFFHELETSLSFMASDISPTEILKDKIIFMKKEFNL